MKADTRNADGARRASGGQKAIIIYENIAGRAAHSRRAVFHLSHVSIHDIIRLAARRFWLA